MAVRAADLALRHLGIDGRQAVAPPRELRDAPALRADMIEVEDDRVAFAAVHAGGSP
jgi:hypothetical protein